MSPMKSAFRRSLVAVPAAALISLLGCNKTVSSGRDLPTLTPSSADANAGSWRMLVLTSAAEFPVAPPEPTDSAAYRAELEQIKTAQGTITDTQRQTIQYWSGGAVIRWNEILLEMVARFNLPPAPRPDGSYVFPSSTNPFADPEFPFANPPYAARAYSYVAVAQFEALKAAWLYKYQYKRPSPSKVDDTIQALMPTTDLPSYPSEDAVVSGVAEVLMPLLFPVAADEIAAKVNDERTAALLGGKATQSDIDAGVALGHQVAGVFKARAAGDGMKNAIGTPAQWAAFAAAVKAQGQIPWTSLDAPPRPPMLPFFGQVKAWAMSPADIVAERPVPPPSTSSQQMQQDLAEVKSYADHATRDQIAIANKWSDGAGTYTPPGHWNDIAEGYINGAGWSEVRSARAFALLDMAIHDAGVGCWEAKYFYFNPRPTNMDPNLKTAIGIPNFPSYTSGHSTFSGAASAVLSYLFPSHAADFDQMATEAGLSRLYGGIHYRTDIEVGEDHGKRIGGYTVRFAQQDGAD